MATEDKMNGDTEQAQPATDLQPDAEDQLATGQTIQGDTEGQPAADPAAPEDEPMIPKSRFDEISLKAQQAEQEAEALRQQNLLYQTAQQYAPQPQTQGQQQPQTDPYSGLDDDDYVPVAVVKAREQQFAQTIQQQVDQQVRAGVFQATHADYSELVLGKPNPITGQQEYSPHLMSALNKNPAMAQIMRQQQDPIARMELAYTLAKAEKDAVEKNSKTTQATNQRQNVQATVNAQMQPMPSSAMGGGGDINTATAIENMSEEEWAKLDADLMSGRLDPR